MNPNYPRVHVADVQQIVAQRYGIDARAMKSRRRFRRIAYPRQIAMHLARGLTSCSTTLVGRLFGGRDHTTVIFSARKIAGLRTRHIFVELELLRIEREILERADRQSAARILAGGFSKDRQTA